MYSPESVISRVSSSLEKFDLQNLVHLWMAGSAESGANAVQTMKYYAQ